MQLIASYITLQLICKHKFYLIKMGLGGGRRGGEKEDRFKKEI